MFTYIIQRALYLFIPIDFSTVKISERKILLIKKKLPYLSSKFFKKFKFAGTSATSRCEVIYIYIYIYLNMEKFRQSKEV